MEKFQAAASESCDFQGMMVTEFSELTVFKALALRELGREKEAQAIRQALVEYVDCQMKVPAKIDFFATSLPNLLVFEDDLDTVKKKHLRHLLDDALQALNPPQSSRV